MYDFDRGAKVTGSKFYFTTGKEAWNEWELMTRMIKYHTDNGFTFVIPPYLIKREIAEQAGILPRFEGDFYQTTDDLVLIPTAETPLVGMHSDEIFDEFNLPIRYVAFSPCFRREAGSHGTRDKGLRRVHQFHKIELFVICTPEKSEEEHTFMLDHITGMMDTFWGSTLPYRIIELPEDERSPVSAKTFDIEVRCGEEWLEVSSISNTKDNQSKPAQIRFRPAVGGKPKKCHLLNGSGLALPRLILALDARE